ncbi:hypothetical protein ABPG72_018770 [Tetrahymena utriculariae]
MGKQQQSSYLKNHIQCINYAKQPNIADLTPYYQIFQKRMGLCCSNIKQIIKILSETNPIKRAEENKLQMLIIRINLMSSLMNSQQQKLSLQSMQRNPKKKRQLILSKLFLFLQKIKNIAPGIATEQIKKRYYVRKKKFVSRRIMTLDIKIQNRI